MTTLTCACCFTESPYTDFIICGNFLGSSYKVNENHHSICKECVMMGMDNAIGEQKLFLCVHGCNRKYSQRVLFSVITDKKKQKAYKVVCKELSRHKQLNPVRRRLKDSTRLEKRIEFPDDGLNRDPAIIYCCVPMVREYGCNHMVCPRCKTHWCDVCKQRIRGAVYKHYREFMYEMDSDESGSGKCPMMRT